MRRFGLPLVFALLTAVPACEPAAPARSALGYSADAKRAYDEAMKEFDAHNWAESQALFRDVKKRYSYSKFARLSELRIADADFKQDKFAEALRGYKQFIHDHKSDQDEVEYARSRAAETQYQQVSDSLLLPAQEERDQAAALDAYKELTSFLRDYPGSKQSPHVCGILEEISTRLVRHELSVARFYLARDNFDAAVGRAQYAIRNYAGNEACAGVANPEHVRPADEFGLAPDAFLLLGETYLKMRRYDDAKSTFQVLLDRYPRSPLGTQAREYIGTIAEKTASKG
jgi:outer membrane protein assembly factor BamD